LCSSTVLTLLILPVLAIRFARVDGQKYRARSGDRADTSA
jgi:hypothetical protein